MSSENDEKGDSSWLASSPSGAGGKRAVSQANGKFSFKEPETTEFVVKPSSGMRGQALNGSVSRSTYVFSEPSDKNDMGEMDAEDPEVAAAPAKSLRSSAAPAANGQAASSALPSLADMFKPKPGEWDCAKCMTRNKADAKVKCMSCEEPKPGAPAPSGGGGSAGGASFSFGTKAAAAAKSRQKDLGKP